MATAQYSTNVLTLQIITFTKTNNYILYICTIAHLHVAFHMKDNC